MATMATVTNIAAARFASKNKRKLSSVRNVGDIVKIKDDSIVLYGFVPLRDPRIGEKGIIVFITSGFFGGIIYQVKFESFHFGTFERAYNEEDLTDPE